MDNNNCDTVPQIFKPLDSDTVDIRSLSSNYDNVIQCLSRLEHEFSVVALSEAWLTENSKEMFKLPNYNSVHYVRLNRPGGGASVFVHYDYGFKPRPEF